VIRLVVVENTARWPFRFEGAEVVSSRAYLSEPRYAELRPAMVFNVCRTYGYQSVGYYVSLLAAARGHRPLPSVATLQDLRLAPVVRIVSEELEEEIERALKPLRSQVFDLSIYFGRNLARRYDRLSHALFNQFPAPFLRARFVRHANGKHGNPAGQDGWRLQSIRPIATAEIPESHADFVIEQARAHFERPRRPRKRAVYRYDLAILRDPDERYSPSNEGAIRRFVRAAREQGIDTEEIGREEAGDIAEFDALFIRETTYVEHHTYRLARRAAAEGLVVIDDPESILRCTNKVFQAELFARHGIASPETLVVHEGNVDQVAERVGFPCVLKRPDSSFSQGVVKIRTPDELALHLERFFEDSELVVAQRFVPSEFDWRVGVLNRRALWAAKYHMAKGHWQIVAADDRGGRRWGKVEALALDEVPTEAVKLAERSAALMGDGLYGVDIKQLGRRFLVMEVNDNPNIDAGFEDRVLGDRLYAALARFFRERLDSRGGAPR
jgi:glutathione synthase/RimK-type ligase-like ATP-grasp enzyme